VIDPATTRVIGHAREAKAAGCDALVVTAPFYTITSQSETIDHFRRIRDAVDLPILAYDIPVCVHTKLARSTVVTLAREGVIAGLKDSSGDDGNFRFVRLDLADRPDISLMTGSEIVVDCALLMGAHGVVPGLANVDPAGYVRLWNAAQRGDWAAARAEQERLCRLFEIVWVAAGRLSGGASGVGGFKTAMTLLGVIAANVMAAPRGNLDADETRRVAGILAEAGLRSVTCVTARTHMAREIGEVPDVAARLIASQGETLRALGRRLRERDCPVIATCARGSSDHAAGYLKYLFEIMTGTPVASIGPSIASIYKAPLRLEGAALVTISQSGRSPDLLALEEAARKRGRARHRDRQCRRQPGRRGRRHRRPAGGRARDERGGDQEFRRLLHRRRRARGGLDR
jgi:4-hydroxy-tetrahydrodipicolinate synthase